MLLQPESNASRARAVIRIAPDNARQRWEQACCMRCGWKGKFDFGNSPEQLSSKGQYRNLGVSRDLLKSESWMRLMALAGSLKGIGTIIADGKRHENVAYDLTISNTTSKQAAEGTIALPSPWEAFDVMNAGSFTLELKSKRTVALKGLGYIAPGTTVKVMATGPLPGFW